MHRRPRRRTVVLLALLATALAASVAVASHPKDGHVRPARSKPRPNIVVVMTDDQDEGTIRFMPNVRRLLARRGTTFRNSFVSYPLCCPSRATFLTGQYAHNNGVRENGAPTGGYRALDGRKTLPVWLRRAGYRTVHIGKYLNGYGQKRPREIPPGWSDWYGAIDPTTTYEFNYTLNENGRVVHYGGRPSDYKTDVLGRIAVRMIRRLAPKRRPFFLYLATAAPHDEQRIPDEGNQPLRDKKRNPRPAPRDKNRFNHLRLPRPPSFNEADVSDKPAHIRNHPLIAKRNIPSVEREYRDRARSLLAVDDAVGKMVRALKRSGELDNTLFVFTSDNGFFRGQHRIPRGKLMVYEPSVRVPLIVRGPGVRPNKRVSELVANVDLAPTILDLANARANLTIDGVSLTRLFRGRRLRHKRDILLEAGDGRRDARRQKATPDFFAIRTPRYVWVEYPFTGERELYDLKRDPYQLRSRHADPRYARVRAVLSRRLAPLRTCSGRRCRVRSG